jgi:nicotinamide mononucleotide transporter
MEDKHLYPIAWCTSKDRLLGILLFVLTWICIAFMLKFYTKSDTIILDSLVTSSAITAMWWMATRKIDNWLAWIFSNLIAIPLNFYKGFILFTIMYMIFLWMAWLGFKNWRKSIEISSTN